MLEKVTTFKDVDEWEKFNNALKIPSTLQFLMSHFGIRMRSMTGMIGCMGSGKSSLLQKIIAQTAESHRCLVYLSEENKVEYTRGLRNYNKNLDIFKNIVFAEESKIPTDILNNHDKFLKHFQDLYVESNCDIAFLDNITTSQFYSEESGFRNQSKTARFLHTMTKNKNINATIFYLAHTHAGITDNCCKIINPEDIRGNKQIAIKSEYFYCLHKFTSKEEQATVLKIAKHRFHPEASGFFNIFWKDGKYTYDKKIGFEVVNAIFKDRDHFNFR